MWRQDASPGNFDSDRSISDEEDFNRDFGNNCISLTENTAKEEGMAVLSRLEMLQGEHELSSGKKISSEMIEACAVVKLYL
ncbi:hypothetical protein Tsubulata_041077 [Turnera subulata]|uniref:Uncharacterized protein n=1 Tax=Turnera subulata TaxID=218843 RepID=A0A9Q0FPV1_9ROSI|nr:hypothetical protein Tsubulata_041077 [Turnera subulata]